MPQTLIFKSHLALCNDCRNYLDSYQRTIHLAKSALQIAPATPNAPLDSPTVSPAQPPLPPMPEELIQAILKAQRES